MYGGLAGAFTDGVKDGYAFVDKAKAAQDEAQKRKMALEKQQIELDATNVVYQNAMGGNAGAQPQQDAMKEVQQVNAGLQKQLKKANGVNMDIDMNGLNAQNTIKDRDEYLKTLNSKIKNNPAMYSSLQLKGNVEVLNRANTTDMTWMTENLRSMDVTPESLDLNLEDEADQEIWGKVMDKAVDIYPYAKEGENRVNLDHMGIATGAVSRAIPAVRKRLQETNDGRAFQLEQVVQEHRTAIEGEEHRMANDGYISGEPQQPVDTEATERIGGTVDEGLAETLPTEELAETLPTEELAETLPITEPFKFTDDGKPMGISAGGGATVTTEGIVDAEGNKVKQPLPVLVSMEELGIKQDPAISVKSAKTKRKQTNQIVIHQTGGNFNEKAPERNKQGTSAHYTITKEGEIYQHLADDVVGAHAIGNNSNSIGIELESDIYNKETGYEDPTEAQARALEQLTGNLAGKYNLDSSHVVAHPDINNKKPSEGIAGKKVAKDYLDSLAPSEKKEVEKIAKATGEPVEKVAESLVTGTGKPVEEARKQVKLELASSKPDFKKLYALLGKTYPKETTKIENYNFLKANGYSDAEAFEGAFSATKSNKKSQWQRMFDERRKFKPGTKEYEQLSLAMAGEATKYFNTTDSKNLARYDAILKNPNSTTEQKAEAQKGKEKVLNTGHMRDTEYDSGRTEEIMTKASKVDWKSPVSQDDRKLEADFRGNKGLYTADVIKEEGEIRKQSSNLKSLNRVQKLMESKDYDSGIWDTMWNKLKSYAPDDIAKMSVEQIQANAGGSILTAQIVKELSGLQATDTEFNRTLGNTTGFWTMQPSERVEVIKTYIKGHNLKLSNQATSLGKKGLASTAKDILGQARESSIASLGLPTKEQWRKKMGNTKNYEAFIDKELGV